MEHSNNINGSSDSDHEMRESTMESTTELSNNWACPASDKAETYGITAFRWCVAASSRTTHQTVFQHQILENVGLSPRKVIAWAQCISTLMTMMMTMRMIRPMPAMPMKMIAVR